MDVLLQTIAPDRVEDFAEFPIADSWATSCGRRSQRTDGTVLICTRPKGHDGIHVVHRAGVWGDHRSTPTHYFVRD
jgi:hypothetical protein